jgi:hypothetical protein
MKPALTTFHQGARIGIIADTHCGEERRLPAAVFAAVVAHQGGVLFVNPGSATLPARPGPRGLGTVAVLDMRHGVASVEIVDL